MKELRVVKVDNGYVVYVTSQGNQTLNDRKEVHVAKNKNELVGLFTKLVS